MKLKRITALLLCLALIFTFCSCGTSTTADTKNAQDKSTTEEIEFKQNYTPVEVYDDFCAKAYDGQTLYISGTYNSKPCSFMLNCGTSLTDTDMCFECNGYKTAVSGGRGYSFNSTNDRYITYDIESILNTCDKYVTLVTDLLDLAGEFVSEISEKEISFSDGALYKIIDSIKDYADSIISENRINKETAQKIGNIVLENFAALDIKLDIDSQPVEILSSICSALPTTADFETLYRDYLGCIKEAAALEFESADGTKGNYKLKIDADKLIADTLAFIEENSDKLGNVTKIDGYKEFAESKEKQEKLAALIEKTLTDTDIHFTVTDSKITGIRSGSTLDLTFSDYDEAKFNETCESVKAMSENAKHVIDIAEYGDLIKQLIG